MRRRTGRRSRTPALSVTTAPGPHALDLVAWVDADRHLDRAGLTRLAPTIQEPRCVTFFMAWFAVAGPRHAMPCPAASARRGQGRSQDPGLGERVARIVPQHAWRRSPTYRTVGRHRRRAETDDVGWHASVERDGVPVALVYVVAGPDARVLLAQELSEVRVGLERDRVGIH